MPDSNFSFTLFQIYILVYETTWNTGGFQQLSFCSFPGFWHLPVFVDFNCGWPRYQENWNVQNGLIHVTGSWSWLPAENSAGALGLELCFVSIWSSLHGSFGFFTAWWLSSMKKCSKRTNTSIQTLTSLLPSSHLLIFHWPKPGMQPSLGLRWESIPQRCKFRGSMLHWGLPNNNLRHVSYWSYGHYVSLSPHLEQGTKIAL